MGDFIGPIVDAGLQLWGTMVNLKENLDYLEVSMERLKQVYEDVKERAEGEEKLHRKRKRTNEVVGWLFRVKSLEEEVIVILNEGKEQQQKKYDLLSTYKFGKKVSKMLNKVNNLSLEKCSLDEVTVFVRAVWVNEKPIENTVGLDNMVEEVWRCINEDTDLHTIGLYGLGGVGKTTLLKKINNEFLNRKSHGFDAVIWVSVSKQPDLGKILGEIMRQLQIPEGVKRASERKYLGEFFCTRINNVLSEKKFVVLLDDIWERLDLAELGVPIQHLQLGSKVVFTTRSLEICGFMDAHFTIPVGGLTPEDALNLFRTKVSTGTLNSHPRISELAESMAAECKGLPLALVTLGRAMASRRIPEEWEHAISILRNSPSQLTGMNDVLLLLKFSFDRLENDLLKSCFLYCSLFPEHYHISKEELIELWIGEGFLSKSPDVYGRLINDQKEGECIIGSLKQACLLESGESEEFVTVHQMIRDMALWECGGTIKIYERRDTQSTQAYGSGSWNEIERISLWDPRIEDLEAINNTKVPNLLTFICKAPMLTTFPFGILSLMPALTVLDLSKSFMLREVPAEIGKLINLQYLNLSETNITELPTKLKNLTKLRCLLLYCEHLKIPRKMISNFLLLEVFSTRELIGNSSCVEYLLDELEDLQHISEIIIQISYGTTLARLLRSHKLQQCLKILYLESVCEDLRVGSNPLPIEVSPSLLRRMERLELNFVHEIKISRATRFVWHNYFDNLCQVVIHCCPMSDATWPIHAQRLQHLTLRTCCSMKEVIGDTSEVLAIARNLYTKWYPFSSLTTLRLEGLPKLESLCRQAIPCPFLTMIKVLGCPNTKEVAF